MRLMAGIMASLKLEVVTAERLVLSEDEATMVIAPGVEGQLGILPNHAALMTMLEPGELIVRKGNEEISLALTGGFLEVLDNKVTILADAAEEAEAIDIERAEAAKRRAEELLKGHPVGPNLAVAEAALRRSLTRIKVAERRRRRDRPSQ
jgi:F-type H+-transporting ATPase subunit epsilon